MSPFPDRGLRGASPRDLVWLIGSWQGRVGSGDNLVEEHWSPLRADTLMAMFRWVKDGRVLFYELEVLEQEGDLVYLRIKHFDPKLVGWEEKESAHEFVLVEHDERGAVFLEQRVPEPRWAVYRRQGPDRLLAWFTRGTEPDAHPGVFELVRQ